MLKQILKLIIDNILLPIVNFFLGKYSDKIDKGVGYLNELIDLLTTLRDSVYDKNITEEEIQQLNLQIIELTDKIKSDL